MAAELLKKANELIKNKVHPTSVISGFKMAARESVKFIESNLVVKVDELDNNEGLKNCA
jgi:T-complex protein 1 subunit alpha